MSCTEFRRLVVTRGGMALDEGTNHASNCSECRRFADQMSRDSEVLRSALAVEVPQGLTERVLLARIPRREKRSLWWRAAAAAVIAACAFVSWQGHSSWAKADEVIAHVLMEPGALASTEALPVERLRVVLARAGVELSGSIGQLRYAGECPMTGGVGHHFVVDSRYGKTTIIVGPQAGAPMFAVGATRDGYFAQVVPAHEMLVAVVTRSRAATQAIATLLKRA